MPNRPKSNVSLTEKQRAFLSQHAKTGNWSPREAQRARILLLADVNGPDALPDDTIATRLECSVAMVAQRRRQFAKVGNIEDAIFDKPRSGRPTIVNGAVEAHMTTIACTTPPEGRAKWTLRLIQDRLMTLEVIDQISHTTVGRQLKKSHQALVEQGMEDSP